MLFDKRAQLQCYLTKERNSNDAEAHYDNGVLYVSVS